MNWYYLEGERLVLSALPQQIIESTPQGPVMTPTRPLVDNKEWTRLAEAGWYREYVEPSVPYMAYYMPPFQGNHPEDATPVAYIQIGPLLSDDQIKDLKVQELEAQIPVYNGTDISADHGNSAEVRDKTTWARSRAAALTQITDHQEIVDFDTRIPFPLGLSDVDVAQTMIVQEENILQRDAVRSSLGVGMPIEDRNKIEAHLGQLYAIVEAGTGTPPEPPDVSRQDVYVTDELRADLLIERHWFQQDAWTGWGWRATLRRKEVSENFWIADYDANGTYLSTPGFTETEEGSGIWICNQDLNNWAGQANKRVHILQLCNGHITRGISKKVTLSLDLESVVAPVRYGGSVGREGVAADGDQSNGRGGGRGNGRQKRNRVLGGL